MVIRKPTARFDDTSRLEGAKGRNSVAGALRKLQPWRPMGLPRGSCGNCGEETRARAECVGINTLTSLLVCWPNTAGNPSPRQLSTVHVLYCCITNYPKTQRLGTSLVAQ